jgi:hypothetical protein
MVETRARNGGSDQYFTKQYIADYLSCIVYERYGNDPLYIEPTAGNGAFLKRIPGIIGFDLYPQNEAIIEANVFDLKFFPNNVLIGNPPFGTNSSLAIKIFNHIAKFQVKAICFIVPKTFKKQSVHDKLDRNYWLVEEYDIPFKSFVVSDSEYGVPCVFQIWEHSVRKRETKVKQDCPWIEFVPKNQADIAVRRVGGKAGCLLGGLDHQEASTYFLKIRDPLVVKAIQLMNRSFVDFTASVRSISKDELCSEINKIMNILKE